MEGYWDQDGVRMVQIDEHPGDNSQALLTIDE